MIYVLLAVIPRICAANYRGILGDRPIIRVADSGDDVWEVM